MRVTSYVAMQHWPHRAARKGLTGAERMQVEVLGFEGDIRGRWAAEAMRWMLQSSSRHLTTRSHQVVCKALPCSC